MLGRMCRIPVGMNELTLLPRALSTLTLLSLFPEPLMLHSAELGTVRLAGRRVGCARARRGRGICKVERRKRQSVSQTREKPLLENNCSPGLVNPPPFDFSRNLSWKSCQKCSAHPHEPHLCPILLPGSTALPPLQDLCSSFPGGISALPYSGLGLCIHRRLLPSGGLSSAEGSQVSPWVLPPANLSFCSRLVMVPGQMGPLCAAHTSPPCSWRCFLRAGFNQQLLKPLQCPEPHSTNAHIWLHNLKHLSPRL